MAKDFLTITGCGLNTKISITKSAENFLNDECRNKLVLAACIWGKARTGKSTFLNTLISCFEENHDSIRDDQQIKSIEDTFPSEYTEFCQGVTESNYL